MTTITKGQKAPDFKGKDQDGNDISLGDFKGSKLVLYFYPKDDTPGCTKEACDLRDNYERLMAAGYKVLGVSADTSAKHKKFIAKYSLPFPLLADTELDVIKTYGVWGPKKFMGRAFDGIHRTTFLIDQNGVVEEVITKVNTDTHTTQILG